MRAFLVLLLSSLIGIGSLGAAPGGAEDPADVLREADRAFFRATRERGLEGWLSWFAGDAVVFPPAGALAVGSAALRAHYTGLGGFPAKDFLWDPEEAGITAARDFGWTIGRWGSDASGKPSWAGRYMTVWRKEQDGSWKVVADCGYAPDFAAKLGGLAGAPATFGRETEQTVRSAHGELSATMGACWAADPSGGEAGGKFLSVWRKNADGSHELVKETGIVQAKR